MRGCACGFRVDDRTGAARRRWRSRRGCAGACFAPTGSLDGHVRDTVLSRPPLTMERQGRSADRHSLKCTGVQCSPHETSGLLAAPAWRWPDRTRRRTKSATCRNIDRRRSAAGYLDQGYTGQWYYARVRNCPRLNRFARLRFEPSPGDDFDRRSMIRADGWRCFVDSVVEVEGLPRRSS